MDGLVILLALVILGLVGTIMLIERRRQATARALAASQQELRRVRLQDDLITASVAEGILVIDAAKQISFISPAAQEILGNDQFTLAQIERTLNIAPLVRDVLDGRAEALTQTIARAERVFQVTVRAFPDPAEHAALILLRDVTELQRLGRVRRDFVANISHELRTPVTSLHLLTDTLAQELATNPAHAVELVAKLRQQVDVLHQLTEEMMSLALIESGQMPIRLIKIRLAEVVKETLEILRAQADRKHLALDLQIDSTLCALADADGMRKVFNNLIHNAIKFTPPGGHIAIRAQPIGENIQVAIADTGIGIPARDLPRIFERFYKSDSARTANGGRGTGLGLAIAKHIIEGHGGKLWAESIEGKGSTFYFALPACGDQ
jgi:two-component system phosphate regulon sensor histidine kinase PhoR